MIIWGGHVPFRDGLSF